MPVIDKIADQNRLLRFGLRLDGFVTITAPVVLSGRVVALQ